jgi:hypothetical protein
MAGPGLQWSFVLIAAQPRRSSASRSGGGIGDQNTAESSLKSAVAGTGRGGPGGPEGAEAAETARKFRFRKLSQLLKPRFYITGIIGVFVY